MVVAIFWYIFIVFSIVIESFLTVESFLCQLLFSYLSTKNLVCVHLTVYLCVIETRYDSVIWTQFSASALLREPGLIGSDSNNICKTIAYGNAEDLVLKKHIGY